VGGGGGLAGRSTKLGTEIESQSRVESSGCNGS